MTGRRELLTRATATLREAGVPSPEHDADELLAHVLGTTRGRLLLVDEVPDDAGRGVRRAGRPPRAREPLQHLTGLAWFRHVELRSGPGVFVPRPETELLAGWAIEQAGSGRPARSSAGASSTSAPAPARSPRPSPTRCPRARVHAVELDEAAHALGGAQPRRAPGVDLRQGDMATAFDDLRRDRSTWSSATRRTSRSTRGSPWRPRRATTTRTSRCSPAHDGLDAIRVLERRAAVLLRPGGVVGVEHADVQGESAPAVFAATGRWAEVRDHRDLAGRPRFVTARLAR